MTVDNCRSCRWKAADRSSEARKCRELERLRQRLTRHRLRTHVHHRIGDGSRARAEYAALGRTEQPEAADSDAGRDEKRASHLGSLLDVQLRRLRARLSLGSGGDGERPRRGVVQVRLHGIGAVAVVLRGQLRSGHGHHRHVGRNFDTLPQSTYRGTSEAPPRIMYAVRVLYEPVCCSMATLGLR
jgi:hypothetical protein